MSTTTVRLVLSALFLMFIVVLILKARKGGASGASIIGGLAGIFVGYLARPSVPLVGQLPLAVVLTRGENLIGIETILRPAAQQSFNYVVLGGIVGASLFGLAQKLRAPAPATSSAQPVAKQTTSILSIKTAPSGANYCDACGNAFATTAAFCSGCGARRA